MRRRILSIATTLFTSVLIASFVSLFFIAGYYVFRVMIERQQQKVFLEHTLDIMLARKLFPISVPRFTLLCNKGPIKLFWPLVKVVFCPLIYLIKKGSS